MRYRIEVNREECIACTTCYTLDPDHFESDSEGKSKVKGGVSNGESTGSFDDEKITQAQEAENSCPVSVIKVTKT
ncbi:MAG: ferredoxin [Candidatus Bathyarchaeia archaeon]